MKVIRGAFGGGGGSSKPRVPEEENDSLSSVQFATVLDAISEGEIEGIEGGAKGVYLDGTPLQDGAGKNNFTGYTLTTRDGTQAQSYISDRAGVESEKNVGLAVVKATPITRQITDTEVDRVRVTLQIPALQNVEDDGDIRGTSVQIKIHRQHNSGGFELVVNDTINGKTSSSYQKDYMIPLIAGRGFPVDIKVERVTDDSTSQRLANATNWSSYTEIIDEKLRYPNTALSFLKLDSRQFSNIPSRKYLVRGIKVKVPHNATVDTTTHIGRITYAGLFNGTLGAATFTNDPAWLLFALLTDTRWGAGIPESNLDVFDFYNVSVYCNQLVPDGKGGQEPRFSCNMVLNTRKEVYSAIQELTSLFRGIAYYGAGTLVLNQDKPTDSRYQLGPSNVIGGDFVYAGSALKTRHTCATVAYQSYEQLGEVLFEYVELADQVAKYGVVNKEVRAIGCYSQGQAHRLGKWLLLTEAKLTQTVSFGVSAESGLVLRPGIVVDIADPVKAGTRRSGRISSATLNSITVDSSADLSVSLTSSPTITAMMPDGLVETRTISSITDRVITVGANFSQVPKSQSVYLIQTSDIQSNQFRILSVAESDDSTFAVTAIEYNETIYDAVEQDLDFTQRDITNLTDAPGAPTNISGSEFLYQRGQSVLAGFSLAWTAPSRGVNFYIVKYRIDSDNFEQIETAAPEVTLRSLRAGTLDVKVQAFNFLGKGGAIANAQFTLEGKTAPPGNVQNLSIEPISANSARLKWDQTVDLDVKVGGKVHVRHSSLTNGTGTFSNSVDLINAIAGASTDVVVPLLEGEYILKFADDGGRLSTSETSVLVDVPDSVGQLLALTHREDQESPPFPGTKTNCFFLSTETALTLEGDGLIDDVVDFDALPTIDFLGNVKSSGTYLFQDTLDLGIAFSSIEMRRHMVTRGFFPSDFIDGRTALIDTWEDIDGGVIQNINAELYARSTNDDPSGSPTYGDWIPFNNGSFKGRAFQFKAELTSNKIDENILIDQVGYQVLVNPRVDQIHTAIASGTSTKSVTFQKPFFVGTATAGGANAYLPSVGVVVQNLGNGERVNISNVSATGFDLDILDAGGSNVNRNFTYAANGYGRGV
jgi:predicted phage tail protein|tara:strand:- start:639 stop:3941 length:3303 start_codon:yes stop_codon:yes gene_type:complete